MSQCRNILRDDPSVTSYPRSCELCGLGPCREPKYTPTIIKSSKHLEPGMTTDSGWRYNFFDEVQDKWAVTYFAQEGEIDLLLDTEQIEAIFTNQEVKR